MQYQQPLTTTHQGPIAVPAKHLPRQLQLRTYVNGQLRQEATSGDMIFPVARLISTLSAGARVLPGDVIATGTPAGVGFGQEPSIYLKHGDVVEVAVTGLGCLRNTVVEAPSIGYEQMDASQDALRSSGSISGVFNAARTPNRSGLTQVGAKSMFLHVSGQHAGARNIIFIHGLGGTSEFFAPLLRTAHLEDDFRCYRYDLEGHGLSPTNANSVISMQSYTDGLRSIFLHFGLNSAVLVAHSMGALVALNFAAQSPDLVEKMLLLGPARYPVPAAVTDAQAKRAAAVRANGMVSIVDAVTANGTSEKTQSQHTAAVSAVRATLMSQDPEGYAKACTALARAPELDIDLSKLNMPVLIVTGHEDKVSPVSASESLKERLPQAELKTIDGVGHWSVYEDPVAVGQHVQEFL